TDGHVEVTPEAEADVDVGLEEAGAVDQERGGVIGVAGADLSDLAVDDLLRQPRAAGGDHVGDSGAGDHRDGVGRGEHAEGGGYLVVGDTGGGRRPGREVGEPCDRLVQL